MHTPCRPEIGRGVNSECTANRTNEGAANIDSSDKRIACSKIDGLSNR